MRNGTWHACQPTWHRLLPRCLQKHNPTWSTGKHVKMVKRKIDNRIRVLIENGVTLGHRTMFVIVGDKGKDQVMFIIGKSYPAAL